ncbi:MAG TPA: hypothetical protein VII06_29265 [Chloroflexota bacterium]
MRIARLVAEGRMPHAAVMAAEELWRTRLVHGVTMPNGELARIELSDLHHLIVDERIWRQPERIERILIGIFEIREAEFGRRRALSNWQEGEQVLRGYAILLPEGRVWAAHVVDERRLQRMRRKERLLWTL